MTLTFFRSGNQRVKLVFVADAISELGSICNHLSFYKPYVGDKSQYYECKRVENSDWGIEVGVWKLRKCEGEDEEFIEQLQACKNKAKFRKQQTACAQNPQLGGCMQQQPCTGDCSKKHRKIIPSQIRLLFSFQHECGFGKSMQLDDSPISAIWSTSKLHAMRPSQPRVSFIGKIFRKPKNNYNSLITLMS